MAIAFGAATESSNTGASTLTFAGPTVTGTDTILFVAAYIYRFTSLDSVTYNGVGMTGLGTAMAVEANRFLRWYYVVNPGSAQNVVITGTGADGTRGIRGVAVYYTGAKQTGVPDATSSAGPGTGTPLTASTVTVANNSWVIAAAGGPRTNVIAGTGVTSRGNPGTTSSDALNAGDSNGPKTPAGSYSTSFTSATVDALGQLTVSFAPSDASSTANVPQLLTLGVG